MYAITGITGRVGGAVAHNLLAAGHPVRAVVRDKAKGQAWAQSSCEIAVADLVDAASLTTAFKGTEGVFVLPPPNFDPEPGFPEARSIVAAIMSAIEAARPRNIVWLSTIGAQAEPSNLLSQHTLMEQALRAMPLPVTILRPAWFMENAAWDVASARDKGLIASFLQPLDKAVPMVATADIGRVAAELLAGARPDGRRVVELEGPRRMSPNDMAATFAKVLGRPVRAEVVLRETWWALFKEQGMKHPMPRIRMLDGFNEGWITFEGGEAGSVKGKIELETVLRELVAQAA